MRKIKRTLKAVFCIIIFVAAIWILLPAVSTTDMKAMDQNIVSIAKNNKNVDHADGGDSKMNRNEPGKDLPSLQEGANEVGNGGDRAGGEGGEGGVHPEKNASMRLENRHDFRDNTRQSEIIKQAMLTINHEQKIHNLDRFPRRPEDSIVIVVMVHDRLEYLEYLIDSLRKASGIGSSLLIFSHDYYSEDINRVVSKVDFCQMMQIFYPYSLQVYQDEFPGPDPKDCPRDMPQDRAKHLKCNNWEHPDSYGHYREVRYVMTKHHWFWKLQYVFTGLEATKLHQGLVVLMEEDHYVAPDFYVMLQKMYRIKKEQSPESDILTLGTYDKNFFYKDRNNKVDNLQWHSAKHNMGMSLDRKSWEKLQPCVDVFCTYDDYNWDWTMNYVSHKCLQSPLQVLLFKSPRIFHIGECGIHHKGKGKCSAEDLVSRIDAVLTANANQLFPETLILTPKTRPLKSRLPKANGGWGDVRDHALCKTYGHSMKRL